MPASTAFGGRSPRHCGPANCRTKESTGTISSAAIYAEPDRLRAFLGAMSGISAGAAHAIAAKFPWRGYKTFMDVGAAQGVVAVTLVRAHPHLAGIGFDLPPVGPLFEDFVAKHGLSASVRFHAGNFFEQDLPKADVIIMGHILHDWDLKQKKLLLGKAFQALPKGGALIVYDAIIDDDRRENAFGLLMSLNMLIETPGGFDYTGTDCQAWMREAGFSQTRVEALVGPEFDGYRIQEYIGRIPARACAHVSGDRP